jgi:hypothetical protein
LEGSSLYFKPFKTTKMKNFILRKLKPFPGEVLKRNQLAKIIGEYDYNCYCGFVGGSGESSPFSVSRHSLTEALQDAGSQCNGQGATCEGFYP